MDAGATIVGPAGTAEEALYLLSRADVRCAVLDIKLMGETSRLVAEELASRGVRFIGVTGVVEKDIPPEYGDAPVVQKVFASHQLVDAVSDVLER